MNKIKSSEKTIPTQSNGARSSSSKFVDFGTIKPIDREAKTFHILHGIENT